MVQNAKFYYFLCIVNRTNRLTAQNHFLIVEKNPLISILSNSFLNRNKMQGLKMHIHQAASYLIVGTALHFSTSTGRAFDRPAFSGEKNVMAIKALRNSNAVQIRQSAVFRWRPVFIWLLQESPKVFQSRYGLLKKFRHAMQTGFSKSSSFGLKFSWV